jgi:ketosteroid isomerase-like protein
MSSANLDLVRSVYATQQRGDYNAIEWADPHIEYVIPDGLEPGSWKGLAAMAEAARERLSPWEDYRFTVDEFRELDDDCVLVLLRREGRGKRSGLEIGQLGTNGAHVLYLRDGKVTKLVAYSNRDRALADLGLSSGGDPA